MNAPVDKWKHDDLALDLARHLSGISDRMVWTDMQMGPAGSARPDVYSMPKSYARFTPISYEVKISRADYLSDVNSAKWQKYLSFSAGVIFAVPHGMVSKKELPAGAGLMTRSEKGWHTVKAARLGVVDTLDRHAWMKLLIDGVKRAHGCAVKERMTAYSMRDRAVRKALGEDIAKLVRERDFAVNQIAAETRRHQESLANIRERHARIEKREKEAEVKRMPHIDNAWVELRAALGLSRDIPHFHIATEVRKRIREINEADRVADLIKTIENAQRALDAAKVRAVDLNIDAHADQHAAASVEVAS